MIGSCGAPTLQMDTAGNDDPMISVAADRIGAAVSAAFMVPIGELHANTRGSASSALARQSAMYLAHVAFGLNFAQAGRAFGRVRTTAARACAVIEDRREEARLDAALADLEHALKRDLGATAGAVS